MNAKKFVALLLALALCLALLAACGGGGEAQVSDDPVIADDPVSTDSQITVESAVAGTNYIKNMDVIYLGAQYFSGDGRQVAEFIAASEGGAVSIDAIADAKIAGSDASSYAQRASTLSGSAQTLLVVELTDNDLAQEYEIGRVNYSYDENDYNTDTILGALNYVFQIASDQQMPAVLVIEPASDSEDYVTLYRKALELQQKWGFGIVDLRTDEAAADVNSYVVNEINSYLADIGGDPANAFWYAGNLSRYNLASYGVDRTSLLQDLHFLYLGSSVTQGTAADGVSFVDYIAKRNGSTFVKETAENSPLCNYGSDAADSYVRRLTANLDPAEPADLFICELPADDIINGAPLGTITGSGNLEDFDLETVAGAIEYIITYVQSTWGCPVMFCTGVDYGDPAYGGMVDLLYQAKEAYGIGIIDLYHNLDVSTAQYEQYMADEIHPTKRGYAEWWTPYMEDCIKQFMQPDKSEYDFSNFETITTEGVLDDPMTFIKLPSGYNDYITEFRGTELLLYYTTDAYDDGKVYEKFCRVYLPYGYDPNDTETKYNVLYLQHGNGNSPNTLLDAVYNSAKETSANGINLLNNLFDPENGILSNYIIICPTYYFETPEDGTMTVDSSGPAGDGRYEGIAANYYREIVEDLIPQIESQFNVYCEDFSPEGIKASRDHRAWAGYSRGSVCTWYMFHYDLEYFKWWMPMSAGVIIDGSELGDSAENEDAYQYLKEAIDAHPDLDFFIFAASGNAEDAPQMRTLMKYLIDQEDTFSYGTDPSVNNIYYTCSDLSHNMLYAPYYLYNAKDILFKN